MPSVVPPQPPERRPALGRAVVREHPGPVVVRVSVLPRPHPSPDDEAHDVGARDVPRPWAPTDAPVPDRTAPHPFAPVTAPPADDAPSAPPAPVVPAQRPPSPAAPAEPTLPVPPAEPAVPAGPEPTVEPTAPEPPVEPAVPVVPERPVEPAVPVVPERPVVPTVPSAPEPPGEPTVPSQPEPPAEPTVPTSPEPPAAPAEPEPTEPQPGEPPVAVPQSAAEPATPLEPEPVPDVPAVPRVVLPSPPDAYSVPGAVPWSLVPRARRPRVYVDGSALTRYLVGAPSRDAWLAWVAQHEDRLVTTFLGVSELRRVARPRGVEAHGVAHDVTDRVEVVRFSDQSLRAAARVANVLPSFVALHVGAAVAHPQVGAVATYDAHLAQVAVLHGLAVVSPGWPDRWWEGPPAA